MARIKQKDLEPLHILVIKRMLLHGISKSTTPSFIINYVDNQDSSYDGNEYTRENRITTLLNRIVVDRFLNGDIN